MLRILATPIAALAGLAFGSFLNVCLSRWPQGESIVSPRSHCRACNRTLAWWENIPVLSWLALRARCRTCGTAISVRYPLVEVTVGLLWSIVGWRLSGVFLTERQFTPFMVGPPYYGFIPALSTAAFLWLMVAIAVLDAEHLWIADALTFPGIALGVALLLFADSLVHVPLREFWLSLAERLSSILLAAALILAIRGLYWLIRRREGLGLGDAKLMALLAAWLGLPGALLSFVLGVVLGAAVALAILARNQGREDAGQLKLPLGTFLCIGGIVSSLWGPQILAAYLRYSGLN
ncbi:MAG TPA: prepilin peptidase [Terracidiphilus sp.]|nr:prepilin peptidase [Terracidiphilus sp.]